MHAVVLGAGCYVSQKTLSGVILISLPCWDKPHVSRLVQQAHFLAGLHMSMYFTTQLSK